MRKVLIAGGDGDPHLAALAATLRSRGIPHETLLVGARTHPRVTWDLGSDELRIDGEVRRPESLFIRYDVFTSIADRRPATSFRALAWYTTISGWAIAHPDVRMLNRASALELTNKLVTLRLAQDAGLEIPQTLVTNDHPLLLARLEREALVVKPVNGGDYTRELSEVLPAAPQRDGSLAAPSFVQERLVPPEVRVYAIDGRFFAFRLVADALDYRSTADCTIEPFDAGTLPAELLAALTRLLARLRMDYGAADFKACPRTGRLRFLELNNGPMFAAFDEVSGGALTGAMADFLAAPP